MSKVVEIEGNVEKYIDKKITKKYQFKQVDKALKENQYIGIDCYENKIYAIDEDTYKKIKNDKTIKTSLFEKIIECGTGFDISDIEFEMMVFIEFDLKNIEDEYDKVIMEICKGLAVDENLVNGEIANVDLTNMIKNNIRLKEFLQDTYDYEIDKNNSNNIEYEVSVIIPQIISGGVPDRLYSELADKVFYGKNDFQREFKELAKKYKFKIVENGNDLSLCAKNTDKEWSEWIIYNTKNNKIMLIGNTDQCNFWFCNTRKDLTPERLIEFKNDLNFILNKIDYEIELKTMIDPEDWQEIAGIRDAYDDPRYNEISEEEEL